MDLLSGILLGYQALGVGRSGNLLGYQALGVGRNPTKTPQIWKYFNEQYGTLVRFELNP